MEYRTKVMRPANLRGREAALETVNKAIEEAEQNNLSGDMILKMTVKQGAMVGVKITTEKLVPFEERNI